MSMVEYIGCKSLKTKIVLIFYATKYLQEELRTFLFEFLFISKRKFTEKGVVVRSEERRVGKECL